MPCVAIASAKARSTKEPSITMFARSQQTSDTGGASLIGWSVIVGCGRLTPQVEVSTLRLDLPPNGEAAEHQQGEDKQLLHCAGPSNSDAYHAGTASVACLVDSLPPGLAGPARDTEGGLRVGVRGLEPRASSLSGTRSNRLSYTPRGLPREASAPATATALLYRITTTPRTATTGRDGAGDRKARGFYSVSRRVTSMPPIVRAMRL